ncbi:MAG: YbhB/YbcL family Raf kinase inhibitor-like protein [Candidatus Aerophobetes bacterium]|nr:YbhB/YbcL family Raf kinase inhibitor-like protein [Candidatus Aerophobetes bacterium]
MGVKANFVLSMVALVVAIVGCVLAVRVSFFQPAPLSEKKVTAMIEEKTEKLSFRIKTLEKKVEYLEKKGGKQMSWEIKSSAFKEGEVIPRRFTADGENISPPLSWSSSPEGTKALALIVEDPDAPVGVFTHWIIYNVPPNVTELPAGIPKEEELESVGGARQGRNDFGDIGYGGPSPPPGPAHRYIFKLYALKEKLEFASGVGRKKFLKGIKKKEIEFTQLKGKYGR